jgi:predicted restriction endonuclease
VPEEVMEMRELKSHHYYNVYSEDVTLLDVNERKYLLKGMGHSNIWYGNEETDKKVIEYIQKYDNGTSGRIEAIERGTQELEGKVRDTVVKARVNQDRFREGLMKKYKHCCLCSVDEPSLLVASHIKPWSVSDSHEKLDINNGLILCPNHDKLFDAGYISFDEQGKIVISDSLSQTNRMVMHITDTMSIDVNDDNAEYMRFHRNNVYKK